MTSRKIQTVALAAGVVASTLIVGTAPADATVTSTRFTVTSSSSHYLLAAHTKGGKRTKVQPGHKAPKGTRYLVVPDGFKACAWYLQGRGPTRVYRCIWPTDGPRRVIVTRHYDAIATSGHE